MPELGSLNKQSQLVGIAEVIAFLWTLPLAAAGLIWLALVTDLGVIKLHWAILILILFLQYIFSRLGYFIIFEVRAERFGSADGSLVGMLQWTAVFLFGATTLWLSVLRLIFNFVRDMSRVDSIPARWIHARTLTHEIATHTLVVLLALIVYERLGGVYPLPGLEPRAIFTAFITLGVNVALFIGVWSVYILFAVWIQKHLAGSQSVLHMLKFLALALVLPNMTLPFAIQAAGIYTQNGLFVFLFFLSGLLVMAFLGRQLSWAVESNRQRSRSLEQLEQLGRAVINTVPDVDNLPQILEEHVPAMFPSSRIAIQVNPDRILLMKPDDWQPELEPVWQWGCTLTEPKAYLSSEPAPWEQTQAAHDPILLAPILSAGDNSNIGCIYLELRSLAQPWDARSLKALFPALKTLSDLISSMINQATVYKETLDYERTLQELRFAGRIQSSLLPDEIPTREGWELAVTIIPARETSGDFYDFIPLPDGKIGILIADVTDKGIGAALYMTLCRTLIRTYALHFPQAPPDRLFQFVNERLLKDAHANMFVTAFYGVLDPSDSSLEYCNAGHHPPYLLNGKNINRYTSMGTTGMPLGVDENTSWKKKSLRLKNGDVLVLYTDGIPDAQNTSGEFFGEQRLIETLRSYMGLSAQEMLMAIVHEVYHYAAEAVQYDDITLVILAKTA